MIGHVRQKQANGCAAAVFAMLVGCTYEEAAAKLRTDPSEFDNSGVGYHVAESQLVEHGFAVSRKWRVRQPGNQQRKEWPCEPFADVHWCQVIAGPRGAHAVVLLRNGTVLDPMCEEPKRLADYEQVDFVAAVVPLAIAAGTQRAETSETSAPSEGCQSGPKGIAPNAPPNHPRST